MPTPTLVTGEVLAELSALANTADAQPSWPAASWQVLLRAGVLAWSIPTEYGGQGRDGIELLAGYGQLASACLTTCFILSQREAAIRRIIDSENEALCRELLPPLARGETFTTVGLSQLTTSQQHGKPALMARPVGEKLLLDGFMPWVTGAAHADYFITGAALEDSRQVLAVVQRALSGVSVGPPLELMALQGSLTTEVVCAGVAVEPRWVLRLGPAGQVLTGARGGTGGLETSCLALGLATAAIDFLLQESRTRPELQTIASRLDETCQSLRKEMNELAEGSSAPDKPVNLRGRANALVLQATQAALTAGKGHGFLRQHPAQRWARQAMFFLVWSCPRPATEATLAHLTPTGEHDQVCL